MTRSMQAGSAMAVVGLMVFGGGCSKGKDLTREKALQLIQEKGGYPKKVQFQFSPTRMAGLVKAAAACPKSEFEKKLEEMGLAVVTCKAADLLDLTSRKKVWEITIELTAKGKENFKLVDANKDKAALQLFSSHPRWVFRGIVGEVDVKR